MHGHTIFQPFVANDEGLDAAEDSYSTLMNHVQ